MSPFNTRLKSPEEIELDHKYRRLAEVKHELQLQDQKYRLLKHEIRIFEQIYEDTLGTKIMVLEDLEWQLKGLLDGEINFTEPLQNSTLYSHFENTTDLLDEDPLQDNANLSLKSLYRSVAKSVHPDLADDDDDCQRRQALMAVANDAYKSGNREVLIDLLSTWEQTPVSFCSETDIALELVRVIRQIAAVNQNVRALAQQTEKLLHSDIFHFKQRVDEARAEGVELLDEMATAIERDIERVRRRLAVARNEAGAPPLAQSDISPETRIIRFPADRNCGTLLLRKTSSADFRDWQSIGTARGAKEIFLDTAVRLDVTADAFSDTSFLGELQPNDLQALFLYGCDDQALSRISHLTGLEELCLSDTQISDQGLSMVARLQALQRLSIYNTPVGDHGIEHLTQLNHLKWLTCSGTAITEEGFGHFRQVKPLCKAVNFRWQYR